MNALARRNQSAAELQECCFWEALPDADGRAHASQKDEEAGVEMKRPASGKPRSISLPFCPSAAPDAETRVGKKEQEEILVLFKRANGDQPLVQYESQREAGQCTALRVPR